MQHKRDSRILADFDNSGTGDQYNNSGPGRQYNNPGPGTQYNATSMNFGNKEKDTFLADLRITDPRDDKTRIERTKGNLLKDSYRWILDHDDFCRWRAEKSLLWVKGTPGKGKTMLMCGVIDEMVAMGYNSTFFFFCQAADARLNTANSVLRGLLYLILDQNPSLVDQLRDKYDRAGAGKRLFDDINSWDVLCKMLLSALSHESLHDVIVVIDALDECTSGLDELISFIVDLTTHVKVIASSRPELHIHRGLAAALENTRIYLSLELNEDVISAAVKSYIYHKVEKLAALKGFDDETKANIREHLVTKADNTFLWVALVYDQLADNRVGKGHMQERLHRLPPGLDSLYMRILNQILGSENPQDAEDCRRILAVMSIVTRPLDLAELALLLDRVEFLAEKVGECGSLLTVRDNIVYFIHQSAKDFLIKQEDNIMPLGSRHNHNLILSKLLQAMSTKLRRNIYNVKKDGTAFDEICVPTPDPLAPVRYACVYWADHLTENQVGNQQLDEVHLFMAEHFLHWLEALSLLRSISEGILSMSRMQQINEASFQGAYISTMSVC
ncbi:Vegetative incompatibility protein HET-E-1 [Colletotrichum siamense]|uniref:Vegetative incompatibility protein HET-E-1 n=1 Tax=Colletotrichum siamense TaxID=690259 RepID=A0A9P5K4N6_COLSI|nr:Vegetative incompatibility protein HET-E-1 [Colletotrichum siamense]KAF4859038.1 Vegetative incompatibility protein HET-E-1 [Colletotrichum siamense]